ncbi:peptidoglycan DD-metalloendopeptidase family protein [Psychrosphaera sp.]|nr:peptidoglycan DD-metalloendopeptidase family protein [Psychrosphaera sp.]
MMTQGLVRILLGVAIGLICFNATSVHATQLEKSNKQLAAIKEQIRQQALALEEKMDEKSSLEDTFKRAELKVSELVIALKQTQNQLDGLNEKVKKLTQEQNKLKEQQKQQQEILSEMVRIAYLNGKHDYTKLLLNQNDPAQLERLITYYRKLNGARIEQLDEIEYTLSRLNEIAVDLAEKKQQLFEVKEQQKQERSQLVSRQNDRKNALAKLNKRIATDANKLEQLQSDQQRLALAIEKAQQNAVPRPEDLAGLFKLKKKLSWPAKGRISKRFGQRRQGSMRWKGVMIDGNLGKPVNAIADGIILYTDWLKGFGWVTVIDHGKGYMSLYGHNQALLKQTGDFVEKGEPVALLGQSGGKTSPGLYFEIRYKGKTVDPARWCK